LITFNRALKSRLYQN